MRNTQSVFLLFVVVVALSRSIRTLWFFNIIYQLASNFSARATVCVLASVMHFSKQA
jgi:hypothetical protein